MYKWPQGRVIRTIAIIVALIVATDLGYNGAWARLSVYLDADAGGWRQLLLGCIFGVAALAALLAGIIGAGFKPKSVDFLIEVEQEMTRVTWPKMPDLMRSTLFIALMIVILASSILAVDLMNKSVLDYIFGATK